MRLYRFFTLATLLAAATGLVVAQGQKPPLSPSEQAQLVENGQAIVTIKYSAPSVRGRKIFGPGGLISHDPNYPVWRAGANAATSLHTTRNLKIGELSVPAGDYTLYALVSDPDHWQLIVNKQTGQWGLTYDGKRDLGRTPMEMSVPAQTIERLRYELSPTKLTLEWDGHIASVPLQAQPAFAGGSAPVASRWSAPPRPRRDRQNSSPGQLDRRPR